MKRNFGGMVVIALLCGSSVAGCASLSLDTSGNVNADVQQSVLADAYMVHMHRTTTGIGSGLPSRAFPLDAENYGRAGTNARAGASNAAP
jgi:hypothetical protein